MMTKKELLDHAHKSEILTEIYSVLCFNIGNLANGIKISFNLLAPNDTKRYLREFKNRNCPAHKLARKELKEAGFSIKAEIDPMSTGEILMYTIKKAA